MTAPAPILFVTGRLAEPMLRRIVAQLADEVGFSYSVAVLPITVAALMNTRWVRRHLQSVPPGTRVILPGYCDGDLEELELADGCVVERGPKDLRRLPEMFGKARSRSADYERYDIEIIAEINHAPRMTVDAVVAEATRLRESGADVIDLGAVPGHLWVDVGDYVRALRDEGLRVSIDSLEPREIAPAVKAGAELVLSVNRSNRHAAPDWGCAVVSIPDDPTRLESLDETVEFLAMRNVPQRLDPVLEPIGCGFAASLHRYLATRHRYPDAEMMMGIGNLTELTDVDSAGINVILLGFCQELSIYSVLTTEVINWARSSVKECDLGRRLVREAVRQTTPPKHVDAQLVMLRDSQLAPFSDEEISQLAADIKDNNYRIINNDRETHLIAGGLHFHGFDPFELFDQLLARRPTNLDASHAFYLGFEMCKAMTALQLSKEYRQDQALDWGYLTVPEQDRHRLRKRPRTDADGDMAEDD